MGFSGKNKIPLSFGRQNSKERGSKGGVVGQLSIVEGSPPAKPITDAEDKYSTNAEDCV